MTSRRSALACLLLLALPAAAEVISVPERDTDALIAAFERANRDPEEDLIELSPGSLYALAGPAEPGRTIALPVVRSRIRVLGNGAEIRGYAAAPLQLLSVAPAGSLRLEHLTLAEGTRGAVANHGTLTLAHVRIVDNSAVGGEAVVLNHGTLIGSHTRISFNQIAAAGRDAGIVLNYGRIDLVDSVLEANTVSRRLDTLVSASAMLNFGEANLQRVRVLGNAADDGLIGGITAALVAAGNGRFETRALDVQNNLPDLGPVVTAGPR